MAAGVGGGGAAPHVPPSYAPIGYYGNAPALASLSPAVPSMPAPPPPMIFNGNPGGGSGGSGGSDPLAALIRMFGSIIGMLLGGLNINLPSFSLSFPSIPSFGGFSLGNANLHMLYNSVIKENLDALVPIDDPICKRDYSEQCPAGWSQLDNLQCQAPLDYEGPCAHILEVQGLKPQDKSNLSRDCKVSWKCLGETCANFDYSGSCPGNCLAPVCRGILCSI